MEKCKHTHIIMVTERQQDTKGCYLCGVDRTFVECADCHKVLPIHRITTELRILKVK